MQTWLNLQGKVIIVTGGASGIGLAIVEELLAQGANVQMADIHGGDGKYEGHNGYHFWPTDISSAKEVNHTVTEIIHRYGRIDGLVNNAGVNFPRLLVDEKAPAGQYELNEAAFEKMVNINQKGVFLMSQAAARQMVKQRNGVTVETTMSEKTLSIETNKLKQARYSIGIAMGEEKLSGILGALRGNYINALVTNSHTAELLLK